MTDGALDYRSCVKLGYSGEMIEMAKKGEQQALLDLVEKFKQSAIDYYTACNCENFPKQKVVIARTNKIIDSLDSVGDEGRLALAPLLNDADQGTRVLAAAYLLKIIPNQAMAVLNEVEKGLTFFPRIDAGRFLESFAKGKWRR
jgi:hypothetical protein